MGPLSCPECGRPDPLPAAVEPNRRRFCERCGAYYWPEGCRDCPSTAANAWTDHLCVRCMLRRAHAGEPPYETAHGQLTADAQSARDSHRPTYGAGEQSAPMKLFEPAAAPMPGSFELFNPDAEGGTDADVRS